MYHLCIEFEFEKKGKPKESNNHCSPAWEEETTQEEEEDVPHTHVVFLLDQPMRSGI